MNATESDWADKLKFVYKQTKEMMDPHRPFVRCACMKKLAPHQWFRCLYCGEAFCQPCAEMHFGQTRTQYRAENPTPPGIEPPEHIADRLDSLNGGSNGK